MQVIYVPLEHIDTRYTKHLDEQIINYLENNNIQYIRIYPNIKTINKIKNGSFLDAEYTIQFKSAQMQEIAKLYYEDKINNGDQFFFSDIWFPGIESIAYINYFSKKNVKITGFLHAGSFTDTDFVRDMERWAKNFEDIIFDISDTIFVASHFIKNDVIKKRIVNPNKLIVTHLPIDFDNMKKHLTDDHKENIVLFCARNVDEKQPWLFDQLAEKLKGKAKFINTQKENFTKEEYYKILNKAKVIVSYALQENFGFAVQEACFFNCYPVVPNRLVYKELYPKECRFNVFEESVEMVKNILEDKIKVDSQKLVVQHDPMELWFENFTRWNN